MIPASNAVSVPRNLNGHVSAFDTVRDVVEYVSGSDSTVLKNHIDYDAFGRILAQSDATIVTVAYYTGRYRDLVTGLQYNRARWYHAHTGRWLSEDPIGFKAGDGNLYRYVLNRPVVGKDPTGHWVYVDRVHWCSDSKDDTFEGLIKLINHYWGKDLKPVNRCCIVPVPDVGGDEREMKRKWKHDQPAQGGVYNVANLIDEGDGGELRAGIGWDTNNYIGAAMGCYGASRMTPGMFFHKLAEKSGGGKTPLRSLVVIGHPIDEDEIGRLETLH